MKKKKIAIACQGGGSQTAFTSGVLQQLFSNGVDTSHEIVALTGTSGGAINAALAWYGMLQNEAGDTMPVHTRIENFWNELKASTPVEQWLDYLATHMMRAMGSGHLPKFEDSPSSPMASIMHQAMSHLVPRDNYLDFKGLIKSHIDFNAIQTLVNERSPTLLIGAANVMTGKMKIFCSREEQIIPEMILASAAIPSIFPAVQIGEDYYWDGLFSANPPISAAIRKAHMGTHRYPDEIWVVMIDPLKYTKIPTSPNDILERRTQMTSNISLIHDLEKMAMLSMHAKDGNFKKEYLESLGFSQAVDLSIRFIKISDDVQSQLDYSSKLSRSPQLIDLLVADGKNQATAFMQSLSKPGLSPQEAFEAITNSDFV
jgi:NTE family protein